MTKYLLRPVSQSNTHLLRQGRRLRSWIKGIRTLLPNTTVLDGLSRRLLENHHRLDVFDNLMTFANAQLDEVVQINNYAGTFPHHLLRLSTPLSFLGLYSSYYRKPLDMSSVDSDGVRLSDSIARIYGNHFASVGVNIFINERRRFSFPGFVTWAHLMCFFEEKFPHWRIKFDSCHACGAPEDSMHLFQLGRWVRFLAEST